MFFIPRKIAQKYQDFIKMDYYSNVKKKLEQLINIRLKADRESLQTQKASSGIWKVYILFEKQSSTRHFSRFKSYIGHS